MKNDKTIPVSNHFDVEEKAMNEYLKERVTNVNDRWDILEIFYFWMSALHTSQCYSPHSVERDIYKFKNFLTMYLPIFPDIDLSEFTIINLFLIYDDFKKLTQKHYNMLKECEVTDEYLQNAYLKYIKILDEEDKLKEEEWAKLHKSA